MCSLDISGCLHVVGVWDQVRETWSGWEKAGREKEHGIEEDQSDPG